MLCVRYARIQEYIQLARDEEGAQLYQPEMIGVDKEGFFIPPTLVWNVGSTSRLVMEEIFGPVLTVQSFRSPAEAVALANNTRYGLEPSSARARVCERVRSLCDMA